MSCMFLCTCITVTLQPSLQLLSALGYFEIYCHHLIPTKKYPIMYLSYLKFALSFSEIHNHVMMISNHLQLNLCVGMFLVCLELIYAQ